MAHGVVPVSVDNTAMADYVNPENSVVIPSKEVKLPAEIAHKYNLYNANWFECSAQDVHDSILYAMFMPRSEYHRLSANAAQTIAADYSENSVMRLVQEAMT